MISNGNGPYNNYTFVTATMAMSHCYSDIGTIEVDAYINTRRAQVDSIQTINARRNSGFDVSPAASNGNCNSREGLTLGLERTRRVRFVAVISCPRYLRYSSRCSKISFCSTVARIRSFHVNNAPVGYT